MHYLWNASAHLQKKVVHTCSHFFVDALAHYIKTHIIYGMRQRIYKKVAHTQAFRMHFRLTWSPKPETGTRNQNHLKCAPHEDVVYDNVCPMYSANFWGMTD